MGRKGRVDERSSLDGVVVGIFGPTASGKTGVAEAVARLLPATIVSADSMQAYRGLPILTDQPGGPVQLVGIWPLDHEGSVGEFGPLAQAAVDETLAERRTPVVVGGTGLYLRAALADLAVPPAPARGARERLDRLYERAGAEAAHALLAARDPAAASRVHPNDRRRVVRALELAASGASLAPADERLFSAATRHPTVLVGLAVAPAELERRILERTQRMFDRGVVAEVATALAGPLSATARAVIGLREVAELPRDEAVAAIVRRTRRYAAYQRKLMRRLPGITILDGERPAAEVAADVVELARARTGGRSSRKEQE